MENKLHIITTLEKLRQAQEYILSNMQAVNNLCAFDTETDGANPIINQVIGWSISLFEDEGFYFTHLTMTDEFGLCTESPNSIPKEGMNTKSKLLQCVSDEFIKESKDLMAEITKYRTLMHNATFDVVVCRRNFGIDFVKSIYCDTMLLKHTVDCDKPHGLKECAVKYFGEDSKDEQTELGGSVLRNGGKWTTRDKWIWYGDLHYVGKYAALDTILTLRLFNHLEPQLDALELRDFFYTDEVMPLLKYGTIPMKDKGFKIDVNHFKRAKLRIQAEIEDLALQLKEEVADVTAPLEQVQLDSKYPQRPSGMFAETLILESGLKLPINAKTGKFSVAKSVVKPWAEDVIRRADEDQIKVIWYIQGECDKVPTHLIQRTQRRLWEERENSDIVNLGSAKQFEYVVGKKWGISSSEKTKGGAQKFDASVLESIALDRMVKKDKINPEQAKEKFSEYMECDELPRDADWFVRFLRKRKLEKITTAFIDGIIDLQIEGRIHTNMNQHGTNSGRYSSTNPNLQQLPSHSALGMVIKKGFIS